MNAAAITVGAFVRRDWATARSYKGALVVEFVGLLFALALFFYVGRLINGAGLLARHHVAGSYFGYVVLGIAVLRLVHTSISAFAVKLRTEQTTGTIETLLAAPVPPSLVVIASATFDILRAAVLAIAMVAVAVVVFGLHIGVGWAGAAVLVVALPACVALFAAVGVALAAFSMAYKQVTGVTALITSALGLISGVYFPLDVLPHTLHTIADAIPFTWAVQLIRDAVMTNTVAVGRLIELAALACVLLPISLALFGASIDHARRKGTLTHY
jgi:ABC-2 type transport system permease protein